MRPKSMFVLLILLVMVGQLVLSQGLLVGCGITLQGTIHGFIEAKDCLYWGESAIHRGPAVWLDAMVMLVLFLALFAAFRFSMRMWLLQDFSKLKNERSPEIERFTILSSKNQNGHWVIWAVISGVCAYFVLAGLLANLSGFWIVGLMLAGPMAIFQFSVWCRNLRSAGIL